MLASTTHDRPMTINGYFCTPHESVKPNAMERNTSLDPNNVEIDGPQSKLGIDPLVSGRLSYKEVRVLKGVNWRSVPGTFADHDERWTQVGTTGETEVNGKVSWLINIQSNVERRLAQTPNKITAPVCRHEFGDSNCQVSLSGKQNDHYITEVFHQASFRIDFASIDYSFGYVVFTSEPHGSVRYPIVQGSGGIINLGDVPEAKVEVGQTLQVTMGCAKTIEYCRTKYGNVLNFGGIPPEGDWIPGNNKYQAPEIQRG